MPSLIRSGYRLLVLILLAVVSTQGTVAQQVGGGLDSSSAPQSDDDATNPSDSTAESNEDSEGGVPGPPEIAELIAKMSVEEKIAQLMFVRLNGGLSLNSTDREFLMRIPPGGILLPALGGAKATSDHTKSIQALIPRTKHKIPFFIAGDGFAIADNAGKAMNRFIPMPSQLTMAAAGINDTTTEFLDKYGNALARIGVNVHFGPSLTLSGHAETAATSIVTFGSSPEFTQAITAEFHNNLATHGVTFMPVGFPGGEANRVGSDPAVLLTPGNHYLETDGRPYYTAIQEGARIIHVGNTLVPTLENDSRPASVSRRTISMMLRGTLQFDGVVVAGPIDTSHMLSKYEPQSSAEMSIEAGSDMILWSRISSQIPQVIATLGEGVRDGYIDEEMIDRSVERVLQAKIDMGLFGPMLGPEPKLDKLVRDNQDAELLQSIERNAITLLKNENNALPLTKETSTPVLMTGVVGLLDATKKLQKELKAVVRFETKSARHLTRVEDFELRRLEKVVEGIRTAVCVFDSKVSADSQAQIIKTIKSSGAKVVVILLGHPGSIDMYQDADAILLTYSSSMFTGFTMDSLVRILLGDAPIRVLSSETPLVRRPGEEITFNVLDVIQSPTGRLPIALPPHHDHGDYVSFPPTSIKKVQWDFGDGSSSRESRIAHAYEAPGAYTATLTITDEDGNESTGTFAIIIQ